MLKMGRLILVMFTVLTLVSVVMAQTEKKPEQATDKKPVEVKKPDLTKKITGSVAAIDKNKITMMTGAGPMVILVDEKATAITYEGTHFELKNLTQKSKITVVYESDAAKPLQTAKRIEIKKLEPKEEKK